jgi:type IV fimbrial biogenesis protein FimT
VRSKQIKNRIAGLGLIEAIMAVAILALITSLGTPQITSYIQLNRLSNSLAEFQSAITLARSEAIRRNVTVRLSTTGGTLGNIWGSGWQVWIDQNANNSFDLNIDPILLSKNQLPSGITANNLAGINQIEFSSNGFIKNFTPDNLATQTINIQICSDQTGEIVSISRNGLTTSARGGTCA